jgi:hypothetical protein
MHINSKKLVKHLGGPGKVSRILREQGVPISQNGIWKWKKRKRVPLPTLLVLAAYCREKRIHFDLLDYIEEDQ